MDTATKLALMVHVGAVIDDAHITHRNIRRQDRVGKNLAAFAMLDRL